MRNGEDLGVSSPRKIWIFRVSEIACGAICEAKMHYAEVLYTKALGCYFITLSNVMKAVVESPETSVKGRIAV